MSKRPKYKLGMFVKTAFNPSVLVEIEAIVVDKNGVRYVVAGPTDPIDEVDVIESYKKVKPRKVKDVAQETTSN